MLEIILKILFIIVINLSIVAYLVLVERKVCALIQNRYGPNRVGPQGLLQPVADIVKLFFKEDIVPNDANKFVHSLAPIISIIVAFSTFAVIPFGDTINIFGTEIKLLIADVNVGVLYLLALASIGVYGITLSGWASNNKYSLLGGLRSSAQMISYELSMGLSIVGVIMVAGSFQLDAIVQKQGGLILGFIPTWNIFLQPIGFVTFLVSAFAETNRLPFDLPEAEPELIGGYHTEYTGMKFGLFFLAEYSNMITASALIVTLYFGGWQIPFLPADTFSPFVFALLKMFAFALKVLLTLLFFIIIRWTLPRFRYDQLMNIGWKVMFPAAIVNIIIVGGLILLGIL
ncbi:MAG: NADH-quinone oxidoreductase subunit NuoH [Bacteroidota bacterium]